MSSKVLEDRMELLLMRISSEAALYGHQACFARHASHQEKLFGRCNISYGRHILLMPGSSCSCLFYCQSIFQARADTFEVQVRISGRKLVDFLSKTHFCCSHTQTQLRKPGTRLMLLEKRQQRQSTKLLKTPMQGAN